MWTKKWWWERNNNNFFTIFKQFVLWAGDVSCSYYMGMWHSKSPSADFLHSVFQNYIRDSTVARWRQIISKQSGNSVKLLIGYSFFVVVKAFLQQFEVKIVLLCFIKIWFQHVLKLNSRRYWKANEITYYITLLLE